MEYSRRPTKSIPKENQLKILNKIYQTYLVSTTNCVFVARVVNIICNFAKYAGYSGCLAMVIRYVMCVWGRGILTERRTDTQTEISVLRAAWSQLKITKIFVYCNSIWLTLLSNSQTYPHFSNLLFYTNSVHILSIVSYTNTYGICTYSSRH